MPSCGRIPRVNPEFSLEARENGGSGAYVLPILDTFAGASIQWIWFDPHSRTGERQLDSPPVYIVASGEGWIRSGSIEPMDLQPGDIVFWDTGDRCDTGLDPGMEVITIESRVPDMTSFKVPGNRNLI